jgi:alpha-N-acetylglucosaminidase
MGNITSIFIMRPTRARTSCSAQAILRAALALLCLSSCGSDNGEHVGGARGLIDRVLPTHGAAIQVEHVDATDGRDVFELETRGATLVVRGSSDVAVASGLRHYVEHYANGHLSWGGDRLDIGATLPAVPGVVRRATNHTVRYAYNFTVFGYSTPHWDWPRWEREIDLLAMHGFNLALVTIGYEQVVLDTFASLGYMPDELRGWIVLPAYQPWQWLGNVQGNGSGPSAELIARRAALGRRIVDLVAAAGSIQRSMRPAAWVLQAWFGNPRDELLAGITASDALVIDLWGDEMPGYSRFTRAGQVAFAERSG